MKTSSPTVLVINGSLRGDAGNSGSLVRTAVQQLEARGVTASVLTLTDDMPPVPEVYDRLVAQDAFLLVSGVYWNNWGSPLQRFIEVVSAFEHTPAFFGKPAACAVTMDSVGGIEVAARLQAVMMGLGCWSPPCSHLILSRTGLEAIAASAGSADDPNDDVWRMDDLAIVLDNLVMAARLNTIDWKGWPHRSLQTGTGEWPSTGPLDLGSPTFL